MNILELILKTFNKKRKAIHRITYDIRSSTIETEWVKAQLAFTADTDCMLYIHLNYGKDSITQATRAKEIDNRGMTGYEGPVRQCESVIKVSEHLKYLEPVDLMLKHTDHDFHRPLLVLSVLYVQRNTRIRSDAGQQRKRERDQQKRRRTAEFYYNPQQQDDEEEHWHQEETYEDFVTRDRTPPRRAFQLRSVSPRRPASRPRERQRTRRFEYGGELPPRPPPPPRDAPIKRPQLLHVLLRKFHQILQES